MSEDRKMERIKTCSWWPSWRGDIIKYCHSCDRCQKANEATIKRLGLMIHIQEPSTPWKMAHMNWVTSLPPGGDKSYSYCLVIEERYSKTQIFLPFHNNDTSFSIALLIWNRAISHTCLFKNIISNRDPKLESAVWTNSHRCLGTKLELSTAYHPQTNELEKTIIQTLEDMIRRFHADGMDSKDYDGFTHDWCKCIPEFELAYKTSIYTSTAKTPAMLEKGWSFKLPVDNLKKDLLDINPAASSFKLISDKVGHHKNQIMTDAFEYAK
ncbi:hypothetical protein O181_005964 [Austropuccinia psidii MF-1]|uniref:Integrase zinc-binding domain-containing protein n=1 Tax=Austropuccinia psidii MF-1 TaxID=1389203 RepID=A0A9Q3BJ55_9BASI|nr:hypothetical protein [Austropuccinia psidii MF-1]